MNLKPSLKPRKIIDLNLCQDADIVSAIIIN
jgi:hypothetical protein